MVYDQQDHRRFGDYSDRRPDPVTRSDPPPAKESWLPVIAFLLGVALVSGAAGYGLKRALSDPASGPVAAAPSPTAGATPGAAGANAEQIAILLAQAGMPMRTTTVYTAANDPDGLLGQAGGYTSRVAFTDTRASENEIAGAPADAIERGGAIEVFTDAAAARSRLMTLQAGTGADGLVAEQTYAEGGVVLRLSLILTEEMAAGYHAALTGIVSPTG